MKIIDISRTVQDAPLYPGDRAPEIVRTEDMEQGGRYNNSTITAGSHVGTHADAFNHYLPDGAGIDKMPLDHYCGKCRVLSVPARELILLDDIRGRIGGTGRLVLHTGGKSYLCEEAAEYLVACGVKTLVTDALSVGPPDNEEEIHRILFEAGIAVVENAVLDHVEDGEYLLFAFPVKYGGCDGAPVRAVLIHD